MPVISLHRVVDKNEWNVKEIQDFLEKDSSSVNQKNRHGETPLLCILQRENCSTEVVKLLLKFGADINCVDKRGRGSLHTALASSRDESVIAVLVENGVDVNVEPIDDYCASSLCLALRYGASKDVINLLVDAGCSLDVCRKHYSVLHCAVNFPRSGIKQDVYQLLIEKGADINALGREERTLLCSALKIGNEASTIQLLIAAGGSLDACTKHVSPLFCATGSVWRDIPVTAEVVKLLLRSGASVDERDHDGATPVMKALEFWQCETEAIKLLLQGVDPDVVNEFDDSLLHLAVANFHCKVSFVKLLIKHGVQVNRVNKLRRTALHSALSNPRCPLSVIKTLIASGVEVNSKDVCDKTPLAIAMKTWQNTKVIKELLIAGALISTDQYGLSLLSMVLWERGLLKERLDCFKMLLRYFYFRTFHLNLKQVVQGHEHSEILLRFGDECKQELRKMKSTNIGKAVTLHEFLSVPSQLGCKLRKTAYDMDKLLKTIADNAFPLYFDIISAKVSRSSMVNKLQEVIVYTGNFSHNKRCMEEIVILDFATVCIVARYLTNGDLLSLILAFYNMFDYCTGKASKENIPDKRSAELTDQFCKRPKLH